MQKLPLDISTFSRLRELNYIYVDKTEYIYRMITGGHRFFLSRPRRFGKSLLVSTLKEVLTANRSLFDGLWINTSDYQWHEYGVINLDLSKIEVDTLEIFERGLIYHLLKIAQSYNINISTEGKTLNLIFEDLVDGLFNKFKRVAVLVDEYDSPILHTLYNEQLSITIRDRIQKFFSAIKGLDAQIQFVFITGVSSFAKAGLFSGINNLQILTLRDDYGAICGYTDEEIDHYFHEYISNWSQHSNIDYNELRQQIKSWYNGYRFGDQVPTVYNPFSVLNALHIKKFENFWFQSGTPKFLVEILKKNEHTFDPTKLTIPEDSLGVFDVGKTPLMTLMFQAGYLTISHYNPQPKTYDLKYPNEEVRIAFQKYLLEVFAHIESTYAAQLSADLYTTFAQKNIEEVIEVLYQLFAHVPYQLHIKKEKYYHSLFMMICIGAGMKAQSEYSTSLGSIDLVLEFTNIIYVIEVKFNKPPQEALDQIKERRYYERFLHQGKSVILLGLAFKKEPSEFDITYVVEELE